MINYHTNENNIQQTITSQSKVKVNYFKKYIGVCIHDLSVNIDLLKKVHKKLLKLTYLNK